MTVILTEEQAHAVARRSEPLLLSAAAGSGKTSVLVERFVAAVREDGIAPARILAITFTERAAGELRERVRARLLELGDRESARDTEAAFVGTIHGFCARLLRAHPLAAGLDPGFAILDEGLAGRLRRQAFDAALAQFVAQRREASSPEGEAVDLLAAYGIDRVRAMLEQVYAELRSRGQLLPRLPPPPADGEADAVRACTLLDELLCGFGSAYGQRKHARAAVDFDDLELFARELLVGHEDVRAAWSERFELLMVDEFQDTNPRQLAILAALERGNLFTVGDELQAIYGFRHAEVRLFRERRQQLEGVGASLRLTRNFRGHELLLRVVNEVFAARFDDYVPLVAGRHETSRSTREPEVELLLTDVRGWDAREELAREIAAGLPHTQLWRQAEARLLAQRVAELVRAGQAQPGDVVVLLRAAGDLDVFERALQLQGLRTLAAVGAFWDHQQIADLICYLRALANPLDERALYGALASPLAGCSRDCLALLAEMARANRCTVWEAAQGMRDTASFCEWLHSERAMCSRRTLSELIERAIETCGYREHVLALDWPQRRLANIHKLLRLARRFEASEGRDLRAFLEHVAYLRDAEAAEPDAPVASGEGVESDAVRLMTTHAAKGLEFPVVCLADLGRQPYTQTPDLLVDADRLGLRLVRLDGAGSSPALDYERLREERRAREAQEEDRVLYVAMTRARERLLLSGALDFERWPSSRAAASAISWLGPALAADLPTLLQATDVAVHDLPIGDARAATVRCRLNSPATVGQVLRVADAPVTVHEPTATGESAPAGAGASGPAVEGEQLSIFAAAPPEGDRAPSYIRESPMVTAVQAPSALSYTSLSELERCGYRYYLERVLGLPEVRAAARAGVASGGLEARARGVLVHRLMESFDFAHPRELSPADVAAAADQLGLRVQERERAEIAALIRAAADVELAGRIATAADVRREHPFAFSLGARLPLITGVIDLLASEPDGGCLIVDYKSDRLATDADLEAAIERDYPVQRELYALAALRDGTAHVEVVHWFLERPREWGSVRYASGDREALERRLRARMAAARGASFEVSSRPHRGLCLTCPGRGGLCSWSDAEALRENPDVIPFEQPQR